jgi:UDP-glucuronate 4-epimerase
VRFLVTGAGGFVGSHLSRRLLDEGHRVLGIGRNGVTAFSSDLAVSDRFAMRAVDLGDLDALGRVAGADGNIDGVFHLAAQMPGEHGSLSQLVRANVLGTANVLQVARQLGVRGIVVSSSMSVYASDALLPIAEDATTTPASAYGLSKLQAEALARFAAEQWPLHVVCLRYCGIFGWGNAYGTLHLYASQALQDRPFEVFAQGKIVKEFVSVADVVEANLLAMEAVERFTFDVFNIGGGEAKSLGDIAEVVVEAAGAGHVVLADTPAVPGVRDFSYDISKARALLRYTPRPLATRVRQYIGELRCRGLT